MTAPSSGAASTALRCRAATPPAQAPAGSTIWSNAPYPLEADASLKHYAGALCAAFAQGGDVTGGNSQFYFVAALPDSVSSDQQAELAQNGYTDSQVAAYAAVGGLPYLDNTDTVFGQVYQGMDIVDAMACVETTKDEDGNDTWKPTEDAAITIEKVTHHHLSRPRGRGRSHQRQQRRVMGGCLPLLYVTCNQIIPAEP